MNKQVKDDSQNPRGDKSLIIDQIYQVAVEPERYEQLLDLWDEKIAPYRHFISDADFAQNALFRDKELEDHFERAGHVLEKVDIGNSTSIFQSMVNAILPSAAFITSQTLNVISANKAARSVFELDDDASLKDLPFEDEVINELRVEALNLLKNINRNSSSLLRLNSVKKNKVVVFRLMKLDSQVENSDCLLFVSAELEWPERLTQTMIDAFSLTQSEVSIIQSLVEGHSIKHIAEIRGSALATVKTQVRSILSKTETHTQAELIRTTLGLMDIVSATEKSTSPETLAISSTRLKERPFISLIAKDGRRVDHITIGNPKGRPILYLPLDYGLIRWPASAEQFAEDNDLKVIVPIRPGYGHSTPVKHHRNTVDAVIADMELILDYHNVKSAPIIALCTDAFFAYHFYNKNPERVSAIMNPSVGLPLFKSEHYERMDKWHRFILANAKYAPLMLPFLVKAGFSLARRIGKHGFVEAVYGNSEADRKTFDNEEVYEAMILGSEVCLSEWHSAHAAFSNEVIIQQSDWSELVWNCKVPIHIWYGDQDPQIKLETSRELREMYTHINFHEEKDAGQLLFFKKWKMIVTKAMEYTKKNGLE